MPIANGERLGPYEISGLLGQGGMGEVYRARDTRLDRTVAVKTLHPELSAEAQFRDRFVREARVISALSHPNICTLYDVGQTGDLSYLVMEFIAGSTLAERLRSGPLPLAEALACAGQVAAALDHAHRKGIVHRDLKPGNIVLTKSGAKLLDFGIAKLLNAGSESGAAAPAGPNTMTTAGMVVGTLHYMAPEQLQGMEVDGRADLFALGAVIYEMLLGVKAFDGKSQATIMSLIIGGEPERMADLSQVGPPEVERLLRRCLAKDPDDRWQTARDLQAELRWLAERIGAPRTDHRTGAVPVQVSAPPAPKRSIVPWVLAGAMAAIAVVAVPVALTRGKGGTGGGALPEVQFALHDPVGPMVLDQEVGGSALSPDGRNIAVVAVRSGKATLTVRPLDSIAVRTLEGTEGAAYPFWSPDSKWIGFFSGGKLRKVSLGGGAPQVICDAANPRGGAWGQDGTIVLAPGGGLYRVQDGGGSPAPLTRLNTAAKELAHGWPELLPDGKSLLYHVRTGKSQDNHVRVAALADAGNGQRLVQTDHRASFDAAGGKLLYVKNRTLLAHAFDTAGGRLTGEPAAVVSGVAAEIETGYAGFSIAKGILLHRVGGDSARRLRWVGRNGVPIEDIGEAGHYLTLRLSADKDNLIVSQIDGETGLVDLWMLDPVRKLRTRLTYDDGIDTSPVWGPTESQIAFASGEGTLALFRKSLTDLGTPVRIGGAGPSRRPTDWSRDGQWIVYEEEHPETRRDLWMIPPAGGEAVPLLRSRFNEYQGQFSPDGKVLAYTSDDTGSPEVYLREIQDRGAPLRISTGGGSQPRWRGDGKEIYYLGADGKMQAVALVPGHLGRQGAASPAPLFEMTSPGVGVADYRYEVNNDGTRFLIIVGAGAGSQHLAVILNWPRLTQ